MNCRLLLLVFFPSVFALSCNKADNTVYHGKIRNGLSERVNLKLYRNADDYRNSSNAVLQVNIQPFESLEIPKELNGGDNYYMDWYTDDYMTSNWGNSALFNIPNITPEMDPALTLYQNPNYMRRVCLNNNEPETRWSAYDASGTTSWQFLSANERYKEIILRKDLTGVYRYKNESGDIISMSFNYQASSTPSLETVYMYVMLNNAMSSTYMLSTINSSGRSTLDSFFTNSYLPGTNFTTFYFSRQ